MERHVQNYDSACEICSSAMDRKCSVRTSTRCFSRSTCIVLIHLHGNLKPWCHAYNPTENYRLVVLFTLTTVSIRRSQWPSGLGRGGSAADRLLGLRVGIPLGARCLSLVSVACCQVKVSVTGRSLVQRSSSSCGGNLKHEAALTSVGLLRRKQIKSQFNF